MHIFKKTLLITLSFILSVTIISSVLIVLFFNTESEYYQDKKLRDELAGKIDVLIVGSSNSMCAFDCSIIDKELSCFSYNLSGSAMSPSGKIALLDTELKRNPVKTVILEVSHEDLSFDFQNSNGEGELNLLPRLSTPQERIAYLFQEVRLENYPTLYGFYVNRGANVLLKFVLNRYSSAVRRENKGFGSKAAIDISIPEDELRRSIQTKKLSENIIDYNSHKFIELIELCQESGCDVLLVTAPFSNSFVLQHSGFSYYHDYIADIAEMYKCKYIDFNLLKNKFDLFSDSTAFYNNDHLSENGAKVFTEELCSLITVLNKNENINTFFYKDYDEIYKNYIT